VDILLESSWQERKWATFVPVWLITSVALAVLFFVAAFVLIFLFQKGWVEALKFAGPFSAMIGLFSLIFTPPAMMLRQLYSRQ
jgi:hypothetical protein